MIKDQRPELKSHLFTASPWLIFPLDGVEAGLLDLALPRLALVAGWRTLELCMNV